MNSYIYIGMTMVKKEQRQDTINKAYFLHYQPT